MTHEQEKAKELAKLLTAFADGKQLLIRTIGDSIENMSPMTIQRIVKYADSISIKPETKRIALTQQDLIDRINTNKQMCVKQGKSYRFIQDFNDETIFFSDDEFTYEQFSSLVWYDNSPCYKEV